MSDLSLGGLCVGLLAGLCVAVVCAAAAHREPGAAVERLLQAGGEARQTALPHRVERQLSLAEPVLSAHTRDNIGW